MLRRHLFLIGILLICLLPSGGCHSHQPPAEMHARVMIFNSDGEACDAANHFQKMKESQFNRQIGDILASMQAFQDSQPNPKVRKILIFVHGGLNTQDSALLRAEEQYSSIQHAGYYPIFINWNSELPDSYLEHLFLVRQGRKTDDRLDNLGHFLTSPLYLFGDVGRAIARSPAVWTHLAGSDNPFAAARSRATDTGIPRWLEADDSLQAAKYYSRLDARYLAGPSPTTQVIALSMGTEQTTKSFWHKDTFWYTLTVLPKLLTTPIIDSLGQAAWENLSRRTVNLFENPKSINVLKMQPKQIDALLDRGPPGHLQRFLDRLQKEIAARAPGETYEITLIGHSMGTMVLNQLLRRNPDLACRNIVYMAAACSIHQFTQSVIPYLADHPHTDFYNLCLHPTAEVLDAEDYELPPRGSLLLWIDEFLGTPETPLDRTLGRWDNILPATYVIPLDMRAQIHIKAFTMTEDRSTTDPVTNTPAPQRHGDFTSMPYWDDAFWKPLAAADPGLRKLIAQMNDRLAKVAGEQPKHSGARNEEHPTGKGATRPSKN